MPYPGSQNNLYEIAMGITPVTATMSALLVAGFVSVALKRHWRQIQKPGHFDHPCNKCLDLIGTPKSERRRMRAHIAEWSKEDRERFRQMAVRALKSDRPFTVKWDRINGHIASMKAYEHDGQVVLKFSQPRATSPA